MYQFSFSFFSTEFTTVGVSRSLARSLSFEGKGRRRGAGHDTVAMTHPKRSDPRDRQPPPNVKVVGTSPSRSTEHDLCHRSSHATSVLYQQLCGTMSQRTKACVCVSLYVFQCYKWSSPAYLSVRAGLA